MKNYCMMSNPCEGVKTQCRRCQDNLKKLVENLHVAKNSGGVPKDLKKEFKGWIKMIEGGAQVNDFMNPSKFENLKKAMIERKENDSE